MSKVGLEEGLEEEVSVLRVTAQSTPRRVREHAPLFCGQHRVGEYEVATRRRSFRGLQTAHRNGTTFALRTVKGKDCESVRNELVVRTLCHDHPNVVKCCDWLAAPGKTFVVLEHSDEGDLFDAAHIAGGHLNPFLCLRYFAQLVCAVRHVHARGVCHRSVKPENVLVADAAGRVLLGGFGSAARWSPGDDPLVCDKATLRMLPPEVVQDPDSPVADPRAMDVWACGVVLFFMATGQFPFGEANDPATARNIANNTVLCALPESAGPAVVDLVAVTLQRNASKRPTAAELCNHPHVAPLLSPAHPS